MEVAELRNDIAQIQENLADLQGQKEQLEIDYEQEKKRFEEIKELRSTLNDEIVKEKSLFQLQTEVEKQRELLREGKEEAEKAKALAKIESDRVIDYRDWETDRKSTRLNSSH